MASGHVNRTKRPNTWLHRPMLQNVKKALANPEPSTHGHLADIEERSANVCFWLDIVAKVFLGGQTKFFRAADAFCERRRERPHRFIQNRPGTSVVALKSDTAAEKSKDQLSRDFPGCSIFDFCNKIGSLADVARAIGKRRFLTLTGCASSCQN